MAESSDVDDALVAKLLADPALIALMPDGVFFDVAGKSIAVVGDARRFVLVSIVEADDASIFEGRAAEDTLYRVEARALATLVTPAQMKAAAARIDALLELGTLTVADYTLQVMRRRGRTRMTDVDSVDTAIRWYHRGGLYQVKVAPGATAESWMQGGWTQ